MQRHALETYAVARWAALRRRSRFSFTREIVALGDFKILGLLRGLRPAAFRRSVLAERVLDLIHDSVHPIPIEQLKVAVKIQMWD
jgi:hypothetical protein